MRQAGLEDGFEQLLSELPTPPADLLAHSARLGVLIQNQIEQHGTLNFAEYMQLALYAPGMGYYSAGLEKFGERGDFTTAPQISPLFAQCLARQCAEVLQQINLGSLLEFGAGSGVLAKDLLCALEHIGILPVTYYILEVSAELRDRQQKYLRQTVPHLFARIQWLDRLPNDFRGVMLANEVLDAMPVHRFQYADGQMQELVVTMQGERFAYACQPLNAALQQPLARLQAQYAAQWPSPYQSEINLHLSPWFNAVANCMAQGVLLAFDYGCTGAEFYHPQRSEGTLLCYYRHRAHDNPFILTGLQDITAFVDFSAAAQAASDAGLAVYGYNTQAHFLLGCGLDQVLSDYPIDGSEYIKRASEAKTLVLPGEMGERFKVLAVCKGISATLQGFSLRNMLDRL